MNLFYKNTTIDRDKYQLTMRRFNARDIDLIENRARQMLNMPQVSPSIVGPTGQASRIDEQLLRSRGADVAGDQLRYDQVKAVQPSFVYEKEVYEHDPFDILEIFDPEVVRTEKVVMPEREIVRNQERPEMLSALGEMNEAERAVERERRLGQKENNRKLKGASRKAGLDIKPEEMKGLSDKDLKTISAAQDVISKHMGLLGGAGLALTGAGALGAGFADDRDSSDNFQDAALTAGLLGAGGYSGYHAGRNTYAPVTERIVERQIDKGREPKVYGSGIARDMRGQAGRGRTGAAIGAGAGTLLGLIQSMNGDEPQVYAYS